MDIPDYKLKQNRGFSDLSSAKRKLLSKRKGNAGRIPDLVEAAEDVIEAAESIKEGAIEEAENHVGDLGTSSSLYTWLHGVEKGDTVKLVDPFDERLEGAEGEVLGTREEDGEELAIVDVDSEDWGTREIPSTRLSIIDQKQQ